MESPLFSPPAQHPVDVIVPVYRGLRDTRLCVDSVLASPVRTPFRLLLINDASPEPEVTAWLRQRATEDARIVLLENEENLGFVRTVNRGMSFDERNDVLLLNSDTEVANDWLDRMHAAAYRDARVASVTPWSTNATICSYPRFCEDNSLPAGYDTARLDALCARINPGMVLDVPTGVGFCMYVRRDCLREIGLFDADHFGKGYGEENDFCQRAAAAGWRNLHLLDTFVLHTGGVSFGASKGAREEAAMRTMRRLHPKYERDVLAFVKADPARAARCALDLARIREAGVPVILAVSHNRSGGTPRHVGELARDLAGQAVFLTLTPARGQRVLLRCAGPADTLELAFRLPEEVDALLGVLRSAGVGHVHYHHLLGHDAVVRELPQRLGVGHHFTVHDYYSYCTAITLTGPEDRYIPHPAPGQCGCCRPDLPAPDGSGTVQEWREANAALLRAAQQVLSPSQDAARRIGAFAPGARLRVVPHTDIPAAPDLPQPAPAALAPHAPLKIVVLGALSRIKGADVLEATALEAARRGAPIQFHLLGFGYRALKQAPSAALTVHGGYEDERLPELIATLKPDLAWFPAQWPETYSYTLSAVLGAGLPVVVPDIGALAERVRGRPWSWIRPWEAQPQQWLEEFMAIRERHFLPGVRPTLAESQPAREDAAPLPQDTWSYARDYLADLRSAPAGAVVLGASDLEPYLPREVMTLRLRALGALGYLRSHPLLQGVVHAIPSQWRQRVNDWLSA